MAKSNAYSDARHALATIQPDPDGPAVVLSAETLAKVAEAEAAAAVPIADDTSYTEAGRTLAEAVALAKQIDQQAKDLATPFAKVAASIRAVAKSATDKLEAVKADLGSRMGAYHVQETRRREAAARESVEQQIAVLGEVMEAPETTALPSAGVSIRRNITWEVVDEAAVPRAMLEVSSKLVNEWATAHRKTILDAVDGAGEPVVFQGIRFSADAKAVSRGTK